MSISSADPAREAAPPAQPSLAEATVVWLKIGLLSFGGPAGQIALMHRELVEERRWIGEERFLHALNYCMVLPGPEAQQLATYIGWLMHRTVGGLIAGILFILPGTFVMLGLSLGYVIYRHVPLVDAAFLGVKAAVLAVVIEAVLRIGRRALRNRIMVAISALAFIAIWLLHVPFPLIILGAGVIGWLGGRLAPTVFRMARHGTAKAGAIGVIDGMFERGELGHADPSWRRAGRVVAVWLPLWLGPVALLAATTGNGSVWTQIGAFFSLMAVVTFGGAYAVLAYVAQAAVSSFGWLSPGEMVDGLGLAETTPGPLILVLQFVGFVAAYRVPGALDPIAAGMLGAALTVWVTFAPCFFWIFLGAPFVETLRNHAGVESALSAITASVVGVVINLALWFGLHVMFREVGALSVLDLRPELPIFSSLDVRAAAMSAVALLLLFRLKLGMLVTLALCAALGVLFQQVF